MAALAYLLKFKGSPHCLSLHSGGVCVIQQYKNICNSFVRTWRIEVAKQFMLRMGLYQRVRYCTKIYLWL